MNEDRYTKVRSYSSYEIFTFISEGRYGNLFKIVRFDELYNRENTYNLSLGTVLHDKKIDYVSITDNGDRNKILVTISFIIDIFLENHPGKSVYIAGSDKRRTMLYQRAIIYAYDELIQKFNIYGDISLENEMVDFETFDKSKIYNGFIVERRD